MKISVNMDHNITIFQAEERAEPLSTAVLNGSALSSDFSFLGGSGSPKECQRGQVSRDQVQRDRLSLLGQRQHHVKC